MLMSVIESAQSALKYPELAGKRVLITGLTSRCGVDLARAFAEHKCRLILQFAEASETMQAVAEIVAPAALEIKAFGPVGPERDEVVQFARLATQAFGGVDIVINIVPLSTGRLENLATAADVDRLVADKLALPCLLSKIAANRMAVVWTEGLILNIAPPMPPAASAHRAFAAVVKAALAAMTRAQAADWAAQSIRVNAIAPPIAQSPAGSGLGSEAGIAALALYLASGRDTSLSGCVFEPERAL